jgi:hypothetical protein
MRAAEIIHELSTLFGLEWPAPFAWHDGAEEQFATLFADLSVNWLTHRFVFRR